MDEPRLLVRGLAIRFGGVQAIDQLDLTVAPRSITALIGPNGAGKTTAFNCITGFYRADAGTIVLRHEDGSRFDLHRMPGHRVASAARVARTFQNIRLFPGMTALENLMVAQHRALERAGIFGLAGLLGLPRLGGLAAAEAAARARAAAWLARIGLTERADLPAGNLPYGDQRRLEIARAMCTEPVLLCLDEPAAGLNPVESERLGALLREIRETGTTVLLIEHDMRLVMRVSDHVIVLDRGRRIASAAPEAVRADPAVIAAYLGQEEEA
jgi:branched-chain amino acid transport system ATP-binding protein